MLALNMFVALPSSEDKEAVRAETKDMYNSYGLLEGTELSNKIIYSDENLVCYEDRILYRYDDIGNSIDHIEGLVGGISKQIAEELVVVPIPGRVIYEEDFIEDRQLYEEYIDELESRIGRQCELIDLTDIFDDHSDEYLFYRTEDSITPLAALYGTGLIVEELGAESMDKDDFRRYMYSICSGGLWSTFNYTVTDEDVKEIIEVMESDPVYVYEADGIRLKETVFETSNEYYERPAILRTATIEQALVGSVFQYAVINGRGLGFPDKKAVLLCDIQGKNLAPYLAYYYDEVYVIFVTQKAKNMDVIGETIKQNSDTTFIWSQKATDMGKIGYTAGINSYLE